MKNPETFVTSAYLGRNPGIISAWHFESQPVTEIGESVLLARALPSLGVPCRAECVSFRTKIQTSRCSGGTRWA